MGRRTDRFTVEAGLKFSVYDLVRAARILPGQDGGGQISWVSLPSRRECGRIGFTLSMTNPATANARLTYVAAGRKIDERVRLERTPCPFGGWHLWFVCPQSGRRTGKLYVAPDATRFAARPVHRLAYQSGRSGALQRSHEHRRRLYTKLRASYPPTDDGPPPRPRWMHSTTYGAQLHALMLAEIRHDAADVADLEVLLRRFDRGRASPAPAA